MKSYHQNVYLVRHGETEWTQSRQHTGLTDIPLTDEGRLQVDWLKPYFDELRFKKVFCSPLKRARETCEIAGFGKQAEIDPDLVEWDYGDYEGKTTAEIREENPKWNLFKNGAPNGESVGDVSTRAQRVIARVKAIPGDVILFSSGHFSRALAAKWLHLPISEARLFLLSTASVSCLGYERESPVIVRWNETHS